MKVVDFHCDVLYKMLLDEKLTFNGESTGMLDVTYERLKKAGTVLQTFAIYIPPSLNGRIEPILESIDRFHQQVMACEDMMFIRTASELQLCMEQGKIGALLSLEGVDGLQGQLSLLRVLERLGIRAAGLTWNNANWAADGALEPRGGGLTGKGKLFIEECNRLSIIPDVSHLSERAFWDVVQLSAKPIIASHSNAKALCNHPRNLNDEQVKGLIARNGLIGITYVPWFVNETGQATIDDILHHIEHVCELGGQDHIMLGSDFDGIDTYVAGLTHPGEVASLRDALLKRYSEELTQRFLSNNALEFLLRELPPQ